MEVTSNFKVLPLICFSWWTFLFFSDCEKLLCFRYYDGTTLDYLAQSDPLIIKHPVDKLKKLIKVRRQKYDGIENNAFQDESEHPVLQNSNSLEDLEGSKESVCTWTKKKSPNGVCSESMGGTKKKIRAKANLNSPDKEYYQIWNASNSPSPDSEGEDRSISLFVLIFVETVSWRFAKLPLGSSGSSLVISPHVLNIKISCF